MKFKISIKRLLTLFLIFPIIISLFIGFLPNRHKVYASTNGLSNQNIYFSVLIPDPNNVPAQQYLGSATYHPALVATLQQGSNTLRSIPIVPPPTVKNNTLTLSWIFHNVSPGNYQVCNYRDKTNICNNVTSSQFNKPIYINYTANSSSTSAAPQGPTNYTAPPPATTNTNPTPANSSGASAPTCESSNFPLAWLTCAVINEIGSIDTYLESIISNLLQTHSLTYSSTDCGTTQPDASQACIYSVWSNFRTYADILLVIGILVVVFAESIGGGLIDAYSIRKMLPRILAAAIFINLSIYIVGALMDITNILGKGIYDLIEAPFKGPAGKGSTGWSINPDGGTGFLIGGGFVIIVGTILGLVYKLAKNPTKMKSALDAVVGLLFLVGLPFILAIIGIVITIIFRIGIIYFLTIISPIAFALYVLPNTEQYFKKWWKILAEALLVYPIVMIVFAMAGVAGVIISGISGPGLDGWLTNLLGVVATITPLFLIPFAFKIAGGTIGAIHGGVTKFRQQGHSAIKGDARDPNSLQNKMRNRLKTGRNELGVSNQAVGAWLNPKYLKRGGINGRRAELAERKEAEAGRLAAQSLESNAIWQSHKNDERFHLAHANRALAVEKMQEAMKKGDQTGTDAWRQSIAAADLIPRSSGSQAMAAQNWAASGFEISGGIEGYRELSKTMAAISGASVKVNDDGSIDYGGSTATQRSQYGKMMDNAQFAQRQAGNLHLGGINHGGSYDAKAGFAKVGDYQFSQAKTASYKEGLEQFAGGAENSDQVIQKLSEGSISEGDINTWVQRLAGGLPTATGANKEEIERQLAIFRPVADTQGPGIMSAEVRNNLRLLTNTSPSARSAAGIPHEEVEKIINPNDHK